MGAEIGEPELNAHELPDLAAAGQAELIAAEVPDPAAAGQAELTAPEQPELTAPEREVDQSQDGRRMRGDRTRRAILAKAVDIASAEGLEGLSIGRLATELGVSKSGLFAHFGSKQELQLETVQAASEIFEEEVWQPVADSDPGIVQLSALMDSWLRYFRRDVFRGGCFFSNVYHEFDSRPGPVRDEIAAQKRRWVNALVHHARVAAGRGQLRAGTDPEQIAFELDAVGALANSMWQLERDEQAFGRAQIAIRSQLHGAATTAGRRALAGARLT